MPASSPVQVSILVPMRNAEAFVRQALDSLLAERELALEVIVVDDASSDRSCAVVREVADPRLRLIAGAQRGIAHTLNVGLAAARGDVVMRCDADDFYPRGRLADQLAWLNAHPAYGAVCGSYSTVDHDGRIVAHLLKEGATDVDIEEDLRSGVTRTSLCTFAIRRRELERIDGFRAYFESSSDIDFQLRLGELTQVRWRPTNSYFYRLHENSITHSQVAARREFFERTARMFSDQRRASGIDDLMRGTPPDPPAARGNSSTAARHVQGMLVGEAWRSWHAGKHKAAWQTMQRAIWVEAWRWAPWRSLLVMGLRQTRYLLKRDTHRR